MYPPKTSEYYPTAPPATYGPPPAMGIPMGAGTQFYPPGPAPAPPMNIQSQAPRQWSTGLCGCMDDCGNCWMTCFCPCVTFGRIAEITDRGMTSCGMSGVLYALLMNFTCCHCIYSCMYRTKMRGQYSLPESPCNDCCLHCCCEACALCQEYRELKNRGFDMKIGWHGNMERQGGGTTLPPAMQGGMTR